MESKRRLERIISPTRMDEEEEVAQANTHDASGMWKQRRYSMVQNSQDASELKLVSSISATVLNTRTK